MNRDVLKSKFPNASRSTLARNLDPLDSLPSERMAQGLEPVETKFQKGQERDLHEKFEGWCRINGVAVVHSRMDRKTSQACGVPDFVCLKNGAGCCVEFKAHAIPNDHLSDEQEAWMISAVDAGVPYLLTNDLAAAIKFTKENLEL
jgi:hypothetical protein